MWDRLIQTLESGQSCVLIELVRAEGSTPREVGAMMIVTNAGYHGTIGGGALEWQALAKAQKLLRDQMKLEDTFTLSLGPDLGQCCGGRVTVSLRRFEASQLNDLMQIKFTAPSHRPVLLFGAGHVGRALVLALAPHPFALTWIDTRPKSFPGVTPPNTKIIETTEPLQQLAGAEKGTFIVVMTHSHALDLEIVDAALRMDRFPYVGLIGSSTKRARFTNRLKSSGITHDVIDRLVCPIGTTQVRSKLPAAIAAGVVVQLLERDEVLKTTELTVSAGPVSATPGRGAKTG
jgi:xanthine dehydrogenase accessory factor